MLYSWWLHTQFAYPWLLPLLLLVPWLLYRYVKKQLGGKATLAITTTQFLSPVASYKMYLRHLLFVCRCLAITALILAIARPQNVSKEQKTKGEGIDMVLCFDISGSMTEKDFLPNRLEAAKAVATEFVGKRVGDRIGIVIFSSKSFTLCPVTSDYQTVVQQISRIENGYLQEDGTAIGSGLATSVDRLKQSTAKSKVVILLTDGVDFGGAIPPDIAQQMAQTFGVKVYTIGVGSNRQIAVPGINGLPGSYKQVAFNEALLKQLAQQTGGLYFHAQNEKTLAEIYNSINKLEKTTIELIDFHRVEDAYQLLLIIALCLLLVEFVLQHTLCRTFP